MAKQKVLGLMLILAGVVIPLLLLIPSSGYDRRASIIANILNLNIVLWNSSASSMGGPNSAASKTAGSTPGNGGRGPSAARIALPYRFPLAVCVFLIFVGIRKLDQSRGRPDSSP